MWPGDSHLHDFSLTNTCPDKNDSARPDNAAGRDNADNMNADTKTDGNHQTDSDGGNTHYYSRMAGWAWARDESP